MIPIASEKYAAQNKYRAKNRVNLTIAFMKSTEQELLDFLETVPDKAGYIKQLIREDMKRSKESQMLYCDRNICFKNDTNGIGCKDCEVIKSK